MKSLILFSEEGKGKYLFLEGHAPDFTDYRTEKVPGTAQLAERSDALPKDPDALLAGLNARVDQTVAKEAMSRRELREQEQARMEVEGLLEGLRDGERVSPEVVAQLPEAKRPEQAITLKSLGYDDPGQFIAALEADTASRGMGNLEQFPDQMFS